MKTGHEHPLALYPHRPLEFERAHHRGAATMWASPADLVSLADLVTAVAYPHWMLLELQAWAHPNEQRFLTPSEVVADLGLSPAADLGDEVVLSAGDFIETAQAAQGWTVRAYDVQDLDLDQTDNWAAASEYKFWVGKDPLLPRLEGSRTYIHESDNLGIYVETRQLDFVADAFGSLARSMFEISTTLKDVSPPDTEWVAEVLGDDSRLLADRSRASVSGGLKRVPYSHQTTVEASQGSDNAFKLTTFEPIGYMIYDTNSTAWTHMTIHQNATGNRHDAPVDE